MKTFLQFITEATLTHDEARAVLDLPKGYSKAALSAAFRKAAYQHHPDRPTGSLEMMQRVNAAHQKLKEPEPIEDVKLPTPPKRDSQVTDHEWAIIRAKKREALKRATSRER